MAGIGYTIDSLDAVNDPANELAGAVLEVEILLGNGSRKNVKLTWEQLLLAVGSTGGTTPPTTTKLSPPSNLRTTAAPTTSTVQLAWDGVDFNSGYTLQRATVSGGFTSAYSPIATPAGTSYTDGGRAAGSTYLYRVRANGTGDYRNSDYSAPIQVSTAGAAEGLANFQAIGSDGVSNFSATGS